MTSRRYFHRASVANASGAVVAALALMGCGESDDPGFGTYEVSSYVASSTECTDGLPIESPPSHVRLRENQYEERDGVKELVLYACSSAATWACERSRGVFPTPTASGYTASYEFSSGDELDCMLSFTEILITIEETEDGETLTWLERDHRSEGPVPVCEDAQAAVQGTDMPCVGYIEIEGRAID